MSTRELIRGLAAMKKLKNTQTTSPKEESEPTSPSLQSDDNEMDTQGLLLLEQDFGKGISQKRILTTKGVSLKELYETSKP